MTISLTDREKQCMDLLVKLGINKLIAREMGLSVKTVEEYMRRVSKKSGIRYRVLLAVWWDRKTRSAA